MTGASGSRRGTAGSVRLGLLFGCLLPQLAQAAAAVATPGFLGRDDVGVRGNGNGFFAAEPAAAMELWPRFYYDQVVSPMPMLKKRQDGGDGVCEAGHHPCNEIGPPGESFCCSNEQYCLINPQNPSLGGCCALGSVCGSPCAESQFQCTTTGTGTITLTRAGGLGHPATTFTTTTTTTGQACCPRRCAAPSQFQCAASLGGGCCDFGNRCVRVTPTGPVATTDTSIKGQCVFTPPPETTIPSSLLPPPPGCTTGQISCAASLSGGCCAATQTCTLITGQPHCAVGLDTGLPTGSGVSVVDRDSGEMSAGAKAGLAVGVVVGVGVLGGLVAWVFCLRRRRSGGISEPGGPVGEGGLGGGLGGGVDGDNTTTGRSRTTGLVGRILGGSGAGSGIGSIGFHSPSQVGSPSSHGRPRAGTRGEMSEENSDIHSRSGRLSGLAQDYFGPAPAVGPYSDTHDYDPLGPPSGSVASPVVATPLQPHGPGDIAVPVEIDSRVKGEEEEENKEGEEKQGPVVAGGASRVARGTASGVPVGRPWQQGDDGGQERFELYGSEVGEVSSGVAKTHEVSGSGPEEQNKGQ
ncbi:hypothetical protein B0J18DRAFT_120954 [Chaetomium sp. MPI-SDFR-AT-0129]|nr:hypothetical protein B0J18DRAFT_120954 [Chaetomium sp. MPI-SDFR-AT-0129]